MNKNKLVMEALAEAIPYARTCCNGRLQDDEITSICYEAMLKCAKKYDPKRGKFFSYCKARIRGALLRHWSTTGATVRHAECVPLDPDTDPSEIDADTLVEPDFQRIDFHEQWEQVSGILARICTDREHAIIQLVYSMNLTFEEAGKRFDISRAAAQAITSKVIERVRKHLGVEA